MERMDAPRALAIALVCLSGLLGAGCRNVLNPSRGGATLSCSPGGTVSVGCDDEGLGTCDGDPVLLACDGLVSASSCASGSSGCSGRSALACDDDSGGGSCPRLSVTCPSSGRITIAHDAFGSSSYSCNWEAVGAGVSGLAVPDGG